MLKRGAFSPVFRRFLVSYLIVLLVPNIAGYMSYRASVKVAEASSVENSRALLGQSKEILETRLNEVETFTKQLAINQELNLIMTEKNQHDANNVYGLLEMSKEIANYTRANDFLQNFYIYLGNYNVVLTPDSLYYRPEHFYELNHYMDMTFDQWKSSMLDNIHENEIIPLRPYIRSSAMSSVTSRDSVITFVQSLPIGSLNKPRATVVIPIDEQKVGTQLDGMFGQNGGWGFITDSKGNTLISRGIDDAAIRELPHIPSGEPGDQDRLENGMLLISVRSDTTGWLYTAGIPEEAVMEQANQIKYVTWTFTVGALAIGLLMILLFAYRNSAPIARLLGAFKDQLVAGPVRYKNEFDFLSGNISTLIENNNQLEAELSKQMPLLRDAFIKRLLVGEFYSVDEIEAVSSQAGIRIGSAGGYAIVIRINGFGEIDNEEIIQELSVARLLLKKRLQEADADLLMTDLGSDKVALLSPFCEGADEQADEAVRSRMSQLADDVFDQYRLAVSIGIGNAYQTLRDISRSFDEAQQAADYAVYAGERRVVPYRETAREASMYYYPIDTQQRLLNTLKVGEQDEARRILDQILVKNFEDRELSYEMRQQLVVELKGTILKLLDQKSFQDEAFAESVRSGIAQVQPLDPVDQLRMRLEKLMQDICDAIAKQKSDEVDDTICAIMDHIQRSYTDPDLTLYRVAESVQRPERFISHLFKEQTGENLSEYLERIRMNKASDLLVRGELTIDEISARVGYNSAHSFRRAFKRVKGVAPSAYRQTSE